MLTVAAYTGGLTVPSARYRVRQFIAPLQARGIDMREYPARFGAYPPRTRLLRPAWGAAALFERSLAALRGRDADVTLIQREMVSTMFTAERLTRSPRVLDVDDAIWLQAPAAAEHLARQSQLVVCGNSYIQQQFDTWGTKTVVIPTAVDVQRFVPAPPRQPEALAIGWSGTSSGHHYLTAIENAIRRVLEARPRAVFRVVSDRRPILSTLPPDRLRFVPWSPEVEVSALQDLAVGLMPLEDTPWARGKCSFKMLTYMACAVPVVASDIGMNTDVFACGPCGIPATSEQEWVDGIVRLLDSTEERHSMGLTGRRIVEERFSTDRACEALADALFSVAPARG